MQMRKLCPNLENEDGLDTVLEVPIPEEIFMSCSSSTNNNSKNSKKGCSNMLSWMKSDDRRPPPSPLGRGSELQLMLGVTGAPLVPVPVISQHSITKGLIMQDPIEASMAKYIVQQYVAACGGKEALNSIKSMYAMGKVRMMSSELYSNNGKESGKKKVGVKYIGGEIGGFVLWQKRPDLWCLELVVSGCKVSAGSDGKVAWRQTPWQPSHASRGPPRPLRRSIQGLDPRSTANLFSSAVCIGEKEINGQDCFVLRLDAEPTTLRARSSGNVEIIRHTLWGYFSERTGLLIQLDDSHLLRMKSSNNDSVYWETTMESSIDDYKFIDGINIAHSGRTQVSLFRYGESSEGNVRSRMEEMWSVEEVDFNIQGLSMDCFMPPSDIVEEKESCDVVVKSSMSKNIRIQFNAIKLGACKVSAVNSEDERQICKEMI